HRLAPARAGARAYAAPPRPRSPAGEPGGAMPRRPVRDVMQTDVVTLRPDMSAREAARVLAAHRIGGAPVVDEARRAVGVLSQSDLARLEADRPSTAAAGAFFSDVDDYRDLAALPADESLVRVDALMGRK